jgi:Cof subfamily protein (haloacid dehalogenase superfamily)
METVSPKYVFLDIDGTLYTGTGVIPESARSAILQAKVKGHKLFLNTGRSRAELPQDILAFQFDGFSSSGGSYVEADGKLIRDACFNENELSGVYRYFRENRIFFTVETSDFIYGLPDSIAFERQKILEYRERTIRRLGGADKVPETLPQDLFISLLKEVDAIELVKGVNKISFNNSRIPVAELQRALGPCFAVFPNSVDCMNRESGEIFSRKYNKGSGLETILGFYGASPADSVAFGDGVNDIDMIKSAGIGIAMGNSAEAVKNAADFITKEHFNDGLYYGFASCGLL